VCQHSRTLVSLSHRNAVEPFKHFALLLRESTPLRGHHAAQKCFSPYGLHCPGLDVLQVLEDFRLSLLWPEPLTMTSDRSLVVRDHQRVTALSQMKMLGLWWWSSPTAGQGASCQGDPLVGV
jgi:hypothetical protein